MICNEYSELLEALFDMNATHLYLINQYSSSYTTFLCPIDHVSELCDFLTLPLTCQVTCFQVTRRYKR